MHPVLLRWGILRVYSYGVMLVIAFLIDAYLLRRDAKRSNLDPQIFFDLLFNGFLVGIVGARLFYVALQPRYYMQNPLAIIQLHRGGLVFFGGMLATTAYVVWYARTRKMPLHVVLDILSPYAALGHAIGRIGCFLNGCCYGKPAPQGLGVCFPGESFARYPTQLYEAAALCALFFLLKKMRRAKSYKPYKVFLTYVLLYGIWRFFIEYLRGDNASIVWGLTIFQVISACMIIGAAAGLVYVHTQPNRSA